jgi:hypothetical protein
MQVRKSRDAKPYRITTCDEWKKRLFEWHSRGQGFKSPILHSTKALCDTSCGKAFVLVCYIPGRLHTFLHTFGMLIGSPQPSPAHLGSSWDLSCGWVLAQLVRFRALPCPPRCLPGHPQGLSWLTSSPGSHLPLPCEMWYQGFPHSGNGKFYHIYRLSPVDSGSQPLERTRRKSLYHISL